MHVFFLILEVFQNAGYDVNLVLGTEKTHTANNVRNKLLNEVSPAQWVLGYQPQLSCDMLSFLA